MNAVRQKYSGGNAGGNGQPVRPRIDPSGYIYEAVPSNRLQGVTVTCYERLTKEDVYGDEYTEVQLYQNGKVPGSLAGNKVSLNLKVFLEGNETTKANTTVRITLTIVK